MFDIVDRHKRAVQIVLALITLPFAFFGIDYYFRGNDTTAEVAQVGDVKVSQAEFDQSIREQQDRLRQQLGPQYDPAMFDSPEVRYQILDQLINQKLLQNKARRDALRVSDVQLSEVISSMPVFQENGHFSLERYKQLLAGQNMSQPQFE